MFGQEFRCDALCLGRDAVFQRIGGLNEFRLAERPLVVQVPPDIREHARARSLRAIRRIGNLKRRTHGLHVPNSVDGTLGSPGGADTAIVFLPPQPDKIKNSGGRSTLPMKKAAAEAA